MTDHAHRRKRVIVLPLGHPPAGNGSDFSHRTRTSSVQAGALPLLSATSTIWFRATAAAILVAGLFMQIGHARADGSLITTSVQVSLKIQQSCQIDSTDAASAAAGSGVSAASTASTAAVAAAAPSGTSAAAATTLASAGALQGSDAAPKVSCQFDEPYGMLSSTLSDPTSRPLNGAETKPDGTFQVASFWTVLF